MAERPRLTLEGGYLYFLLDSEGPLARISTDGGELEELGIRTGYFAIGDGGVYWTTHDNSRCFREVVQPPPFDSSVMFTPVGGDSITLASLQNCATEVAVDNQHLYWLNHGSIVLGQDGTVEPNGGLMRSSKEPGTAVEVGPRTLGASNIMADDEAVYWLYHHDLFNTAKGDGEQSHLINEDDAGGLTRFSVDETDVYAVAGWDVIGTPPRRLVRLAKQGGPIIELFEAPWIGDVEARAPDYYYWTMGMDWPTSALVKMPKSGGEVSVVYDGFASAFAIDDQCLYLLVGEYGDDTARIVRVAR